MLPSSDYEAMISRVPRVWQKAFEVNPADDAAVRASCAEFVLAGLYSSDLISRSTTHGRITYEP
jgi:magnesium chelatase subunit I